MVLEFRGVFRVVGSGFSKGLGLRGFQGLGFFWV